jgi:class 3 adenylate cyclase
MIMASGKETIILVDDNPSNLRTGKNVLSEKYNVFTTPDAKTLFELLEEIDAALILLDIEMPEMNGYEAIKVLKSKPETKDIPVIFLTGKNEADNELEGLSLGAIDYITKPFMPALLLKRIEVHLLVEAQRKQIEYYSKNLEKVVTSYLSEDVVQAVMSDPSKLQLGGIKRDMTALFTDVRGFSPIAEKLSPEDLVKLLNRYLTAMSDILFEQKGTIDKYEGDAIMAFFGAPLDVEDHAVKACAAAVLMKKKEKELNKDFIQSGLSSDPLITRIGVNSGDMSVGNMGSERKMNYTVMGNAVNLAARLEGVNKMFGTWILISENTRRGIGDAFLCRKLDRVRVVGISEPVRVYELLDFTGGAAAEQKTMVDLFHAALELFEKREWQAAEAGFQKALDHSPADSPSRVFLERCAQYRQSPPPQEWDGVFESKEK